MTNPDGPSRTHPRRQWRALPLALTPFLVGAAPLAPQGDADRTVMLTGYERLRVDGPFLVRVVDGQPPAARITGNRRAIEGVSVRNIGGQLVIAPTNGSFEGWKPQNGPITVTLGARNLRAVAINGGASVDIDKMRGQAVMLSVNGAGSLNIAELTSDQLAVTLTGTGAIRIHGGTSARARIGTYGAGSIHASAHTTKDLSVQSQSAGDSQFTARYTAQITSSGTGSVMVSGTAACTLSGPGPAHCAGKIERR